MTFSFSEDEFEIAFNEKDYSKALDNAAEIWIDGYYAIIEMMIEENGLDMTPDEYAEQAFGCSVEEYIEDAVVTDMNSSNFENFGDYELNGTKLYLDGDSDYYKIEIDGDELTIKSYSGGGAEDEMLRGVVFERQ